MEDTEDEAADKLVEPPVEPPVDDGSPVRSGRLGRLALVLALLAALLLAAGSLLWWRAAHDSDLELARTRDQVLIDARRDVQVLTTLDHRDVDDGLDRWLSVSTGALHDQLSTVDDDARAALEEAGKVSEGTVVDAALTELDARAGTAKGIATVEISVTDATGTPTVKRDRFTVELARVGSRWLVARLDQLPVGLS